MKSLTPKQLEILEFLKDHIHREGLSPSLREIQAHFGFNSVSSVHEHLRALEKKGMIEREAGICRGLTLSSEETLAVIGTVSLEGIRPYAVPEEIPLTCKGRCYGLRAGDDSFKEEAILKGDLLIVESTSECPEGAYALISLEGFGTLIKHLYTHGEQVHLKSIDNSVDPIRLAAHFIEVQGVIQKIIREL